jgi:general secretion pathway protein F
MPRFNYEVIDVEGTSSRGELEAENSRIAREELLSAGWQVESIQPVPDEPSGEGGARLSNHEAVELTAQIAELASANVPLSSGLRALRTDMPRGRLARTIERLVVHLDRGVPLDQAAQMSDVRLPPYLCGLLACGLRSGQLGMVLEKFLTHMRMRDDLNRRVWSAFAYPMLLLVLLSFWAIFLSKVLIEGFGKIYLDFEVELPLTTTLLLAGSQYVAWIAGGLIVGIVLIVILLRWCGRWRGVSDVLLAFPLIGPFLQERGLFEFASLLELFLEYGAPLPAALRLTADGISEGAISAGARRSAEIAERGSSLAESIGRVTVFPPSLRPILAWGDRMSAPAEALATAAEWFRMRSELRNDLLVVVIPPITFVLVSTVMIFVVTSLMIPMVKLIESLT